MEKEGTGKKIPVIDSERQQSSGREGIGAPWI